MMKRLISFFTNLCEQYMPDSFVFCLLLTLIVFLAACLGTPHAPLTLIDFWGKDFWSLNTFSMQMIFVLITGHMLATTPASRFLLSKLTSRIKNEKQGLLLITLFSLLACWINWGFGLIVSGILAVEVARKLKRVNFGLFVASAYSGFLVWHGGLSGSIPLKIAGKDEILTRIYPDLSVPLSQTIFSSMNLTIIILLFISIPFLNLSMMTSDKQEVDYFDAEEIKEEETKFFRDHLENSKWMNILFFVGFLFFIIRGFLREESFDINKVNIIFLSLALLLHRTPRKFLAALQNSFGVASGLAIQFPFYAGMMGLMQYSGLADVLSEFFVQISTKQTLPFFTFLSAGLVNFFIPSGGGQWVVQGPIMLKAALELGVDPARVALGICWGDAWTNMVQPLWALPLLSLAGLKLKDIMGFCLMYVMVSGVLIGGALLWG